MALSPQSIPSQKWEVISPRGGKLVSLQAGLCAAAAAGPCGTKEFCFSNTLGSRMVLQRDARAAIYGFTAPGDAVTCSLTPQGGIAKVGGRPPSPCHRLWSLCLMRRGSLRVPS